MNLFLKPATLIPAVFLLTGCSAQRYHAAPLASSETASRLESRNLADTGLQSFIEKNLGHPVSPWPPKTWDLQKLSLAGLYFNPALESARSRLSTTEAAVITAGAHPNPTVSIAPGIPTPYLLTLDFAIPIETAGKRSHRIEAAQSLKHAAELDLADSAWTVRNGVRTALVNYLLAVRNLDLYRSEVQVREDQLAILEKVLSAGEIPSIDLDLPQMELSRTRVLIATTEGQVADAKAILAAAIGIPVAGFQDAEFSWPELDALSNIQSFSQLEIQRDAVINRLDVRRALEQYAAAEATLQLEISKQYPDINIGPGYTFEETHSFLTFALSSTIPLRNRNQGPIAEAEGRRKEAASAVLEKQAQAITKTDRAFAAYKAAIEEMTQVESLRKLQNTQMETAQRAIRAGTSTQLNLSSLHIQGSLLERSRLDALARAQRALGDLEDSIQRPIGSGEDFTAPVSAVSMDRNSQIF
jgi:outer membrane protein, heavy metal efflux system